MKKYIIISIIVVILFVGGSIAFVKAQTSTMSKGPVTLTNSFFAQKIAASLIAKKASTLSNVALAGIISDALKDISNDLSTVKSPVLIIQPAGGGLSFNKWRFSFYNITTGVLEGCASCESCTYDSGGFVNYSSCTGCVQSSAPANGGACFQS